MADTIDISRRKFVIGTAAGTAGLSLGFAVPSLVRNWAVSGEPVLFTAANGVTRSEQNQYDREQRQRPDCHAHASNVGKCFGNLEFACNTEL